MLIYLASPYTHEDLSIVQERYEKAKEATATLIKRGFIVFSPIIHSHRLDSSLPTTWDFWKTQDEEFIKKCDELWVLMLPGYNVSKGITAEILIARELKKPILYVSYPIPGFLTPEYHASFRGGRNAKHKKHSR